MENQEKLQKLTKINEDLLLKTSSKTSKKTVNFKFFICVLIILICGLFITCQLLRPVDSNEIDDSITDQVLFISLLIVYICY